MIILEILNIAFSLICSAGICGENEKNTCIQIFVFFLLCILYHSRYWSHNELPFPIHYSLFSAIHTNVRLFLLFSQKQRQQKQMVWINWKQPCECSCVCMFQETIWQRKHRQNLHIKIWSDGYKIIRISTNDRQRNIK